MTSLVHFNPVVSHHSVPYDSIQLSWRPLPCGVNASDCQRHEIFRRFRPTK